MVNIDKFDYIIIKNLSIKIQNRWINNYLKIKY